MDTVRSLGVKIGDTVEVIDMYMQVSYSAKVVNTIYNENALSLLLEKDGFTPKARYSLGQLILLNHGGELSYQIRATSWHVSPDAVLKYWNKPTYSLGAL